MKPNIQIRAVEGIRSIYVDQLNGYLQIPCITGVQQRFQDDFGAWGDWHDTATVKAHTTHKKHNDK